MIVNKHEQSERNVYGVIGLAIFGYYVDDTTKNLRFGQNSKSAKRYFDGKDLANVINVLQDYIHWPSLFELTKEALLTPEYVAECLFEIDYTDKELTVDDVITALYKFLTETEAQLKGEADASN